MFSHNMTFFRGIIGFSTRLSSVQSPDFGWRMLLTLVLTAPLGAVSDRKASVNGFDLSISARYEYQHHVGKIQRKWEHQVYIVHCSTNDVSQIWTSS
jgi:hypothetical protein